MPTLTFDLEPSTDTELTCFFCGRTGIDHEFHYRQDDSHGGRRHVGSGVHLDCVLSPTYRPGPPEREIRTEGPCPSCGVNRWRLIDDGVHCANCGWYRGTDGGFIDPTTCCHPTWAWHGKMQRYCTRCNIDLPQDLDLERKHLPYKNCGRRECLQCYYPED